MDAQSLQSVLRQVLELTPMYAYLGRVYGDRGACLLPQRLLRGLGRARPARPDVTLLLLGS